MVVVITMKRRTVKLPDDILKALEDWRAKQRPIPNKQEALEQVLRRGLGLKEAR